MTALDSKIAGVEYAAAPGVSHSSRRYGDCIVAAGKRIQGEVSLIDQAAAQDGIPTCYPDGTEIGGHPVVNVESPFDPAVDRGSTRANDDQVISDVQVTGLPQVLIISVDG